MKFWVKVHASCSKEKVEKINENSLEVWTKERPVRGKANKSLLRILKKYFGRDVRIVAGAYSKRKIIEVSESK